MYKIGTLSRLLGISEHVLRFYEKKGLITAKRKEDSPTRYYDEFDINRLVNVKRLRGLEFSLEEISDIFSVEFTGRLVDYYKLLSQKQRTIDKELARLENAQKELVRLKDALYFHDRNRDDEIREAELPELFWLYHMDKYRTPDSFCEDTVANRLVMEQVYPAVYMMAMVDTSAPILHLAEKELNYDWGMAFSPRCLHLFPEATKNKLKPIPKGQYYVRDCVEDADCMLQKDVVLSLIAHAQAEGRKKPEYLLVELLPGGKTSYYLPKI